MADIKGLEWTFDTVAPIYEKVRPGYVDELYQTIFDYIPIHESGNVIEIGIGGGQATLPVLKTGCKFTAVEHGENFSKRCREKFRDYPNFSVITEKFENVEFENEAYDLVFSASAFHWIPEKEGYSKVFSILKSGGVFARFANHPYCDKGNSALMREFPKEYTEEQVRLRAMIAEKYGFQDIRYAMFYRTRTFSAKEYTTLLGTYSDHIAIEEPIRLEFFSKIEDVIAEHGGKITIYDTIDLQLARKL